MAVARQEATSGKHRDDAVVAHWMKEYVT